MNRVPKISVVTPSYNQADFIGATIESVLSQCGMFEIEYIVMDGGSNDGSVDVIRGYAERVAAGNWPVQCAGISMIWVSHRDNGQSEAINQGLRRATGDILSYLNSDDLYEPGAFERVVRAFEQHAQADFIYGDGDVIDADGNVQWEWLSRPYNRAVMSSYHFLWNDFTNYIMQQATFWRKDVLHAIGYFDETFHYAMDVEYWVRAGQAGLLLQHVPQKLGKFRLIQGTKSLSSPTIFWEDYLEIFRRYRGSHSLGLYFAYFYYNLARHANHDMEKARLQGQRIEARWQHLSVQERAEIRRQMRRGVSFAYLLLANELGGQRQYDRAAMAFRCGLAYNPMLTLHPLGLAFLLRCSVRPQIFAALERRARQIVHVYRAMRYNYRYHRQRRIGQAIEL